MIKLEDEREMISIIQSLIELKLVNTTIDDLINTPTVKKLHKQRLNYINYKDSIDIHSHWHKDIYDISISYTYIGYNNYLQVKSVVELLLILCEIQYTNDITIATMKVKNFMSTVDDIHIYYKKLFKEYTKRYKELMNIGNQFSDYNLLNIGVTIPIRKNQSKETIKELCEYLNKDDHGKYEGGLEYNHIEHYSIMNVFMKMRFPFIFKLRYKEESCSTLINLKNINHFYEKLSTMILTDFLDPEFINIIKSQPTKQFRDLLLV
jgi:3-deoxy-D-manno-octulosonate 8-phosphate phosphatase KdsC-like HAD superfamily phosphatase